jgi:hypothetical protein
MAFSADLGVSDQSTHDVYDWISMASNEALSIYQTATNKPITVNTADGPRPIGGVPASNTVLAILAKPWSVALIVAAILAVVFLLYRMK